MVQKTYSKMHPVSCTNTHHDVTNLVKHRMVKNTKTWISREQKITFLSNKKILNLCLRRHILRIYSFVAEVTFNHVLSGKRNISLIFVLNIMGPSIDPCGTPAKRSFHILKLLFTFVLCKRLCK